MEQKISADDLFKVIGEQKVQLMVANGRIAELEKELGNREEEKKEPKKNDK